MTTIAQWVSPKLSLNPRGSLTRTAMTIRAITDTPSSAPKIIVMTFLKKKILSDLIKNFQIVCLFEMAWSRQYPDADDAFGCINI